MPKQGLRRKAPINYAVLAQEKPRKHEETGQKPGRPRRERISKPVINYFSKQPLISNQARTWGFLKMNEEELESFNELRAKYFWVSRSTWQSKNCSLQSHYKMNLNGNELALCPAMKRWISLGNRVLY